MRKAIPGFSKERAVWRNIRKICYTISNHGYPYYGAKGIRVCARWLASFENFLEDLGPKPFEEAYLVRKNKLKNYTPSNCHWGTRADSIKNQTHLRLLTYKGKTQSAAAWARELGVSYHSIYARMFPANQNPWKFEDLVTYLRHMAEK